MRRIIFAILFSFCACSSAIAIQVSGDVWGVWRANNNPYEVTGDLHVPQESTLVIQPGCYIDFQGYYTFIVDTNAVFQAVGTENDSITFTASDTTDGWYGLRLFSADDSCLLSYCVIEWGNIPFIDPQEPYPDGAGIYAHNTNIIVSNCLIENCRTVAGYGGGMCLGGNSEILIKDNVIRNNISGFGGAAVWCWYSAINIVNNVIKNNITYYILGGEEAGGLGFSSCDVLLRNNVIDHNYCGTSAGGIYVGYSTGLIDSNIISGNIASEYGGGIFFNRSQATLKHNLIINNHAYIISGLKDLLSDLIICNNTIHGNESFPGGWAINISQDGSDTLLNNILWGNNANSIGLIGDTINFLYNNIEGGWPGEGNIDADPLFVDPDAGDFHLSWANYPIDDETKSPCIDAGAPWSPYDPDSTIADMGALPFDQLVGIDGLKDLLPKSARLFQNYPNPFNTSTAISYTLPHQSDVTIDIYDILGRKVQTLVSRNQQAGLHRAIWQADEFSTGIYFYKLRASDYSETKKMMLLE